MMESAKNRNLGIELLRMFMAFGVIAVHFGSGGFPLRFTANSPVPVFMFLAFYFFYPHVHDSALVKKRFLRILVPYILWPFIYVFIYQGMAYLFPSLMNPTGNNLFQFQMQLLFGSSFCVTPHFWFLWDMLFLTLLIYLLLRIAKNNISYILVWGGVLCMLCQYTRLNFKIFNHLPVECKYTLGRITEMLPYMVLGCMFSEKQIFQKMGEKRIIWLLVSFFSYWTVFFLRSVIKDPDGFGYSGILTMVRAVSLICFFYLLPFDLFLKSNKVVSEVLRFTTKYTFGIYCLHILVGNYLNEAYRVFNLPFDSIFLRRMAIYICCYLICFCLDGLRLKTIKMLIN